MSDSPFRVEWRNLLIEQYKQAARSTSAKRRDDFAQTMRDAGFTEEELVQLYVEATLHVDDLPEGFEPDLDKVNQIRQQLDPHPLECSCSQCHQVD